MLLPYMSNTINQSAASNPLPQKRWENAMHAKMQVPQPTDWFWENRRGPHNWKSTWKPIDEDGNEQKHKFNLQNTNRQKFQPRKIVDIATVTDIQGSKEIAFTRLGI